MDKIFLGLPVKKVKFYNEEEDEETIFTLLFTHQLHGKYKWPSFTHHLDVSEEHQRRQKFVSKLLARMKEDLA